MTVTPGFPFAARIAALRPWIPWALAACLLLFTLFRVFLPAVGTLRDDGIYLSSARALAAGKGYVIDILPGEIPNTKYPPLTSALVAPLFAAGLDPLHHTPLFKAVPFAFLLLWLFGLRRLAQLFGLGMESTGWVIACTLASPLVATCATMVLSDVPAAAIITWGLVFAVLSTQPGSRQLACAAAAGLLLGLAFLTRTHAAAAIAGVVSYLFLRRHYRQFVLICALAVVLGVPWIWWTYATPVPEDPVLQYYSAQNYREWWAWKAGGASGLIEIAGLNLMLFLASPANSVALGAPFLGMLLFAAVLLFAFKHCAPPLHRLLLSVILSSVPLRLLLFVFPLIWLATAAAAAAARPPIRTILAVLALLFSMRGLWVHSNQAAASLEDGNPPNIGERSDNWYKLRQAGSWLEQRKAPGEVIGALHDGAMSLLSGSKAVFPVVPRPLVLIYGRQGLGLGSAPELAAALNRFQIRFVVQTPARSPSEAKEFERLLESLGASVPPCLRLAADFGDGYRIHEFTCRDDRPAEPAPKDRKAAAWPDLQNARLTSPAAR